MKRHVLTALGEDRPGIVAGLTAALAAAGGNLEDASMTVLHGHFAVMLVVAAPDPMTDAALTEVLAEVIDAFGLDATVREIGEPPDSSVDGEEWVVSVHGADKPGIVAGIAGALAELGVNVVDLGTHLLGSGDEAVFVMTMRVEVPAAVVASLTDALDDAAAALGVDCRAHRADAEIL